MEIQDSSPTAALQCNAVLSVPLQLAATPPARAASGAAAEYGDGLQHKHAGAEEHDAWVWAEVMEVEPDLAWDFEKREV